MFNIHRKFAKTLAILFTVFAVINEIPASEVSVSNVRAAFSNGEHNAFTDLAWFKGHIYLTFRSCPDGHMVLPTSSIIVLKSSTGKDWT